MIRIQLLREAGDARWTGQPIALILNLPDQPVGSEDPSNAQTFAGVTGIAMTHGIHDRFLQPKLKPAGGFLAIHRFEQQLQERTQLQRGGEDEISPPKDGSIAAEHSD